ncbi:hypothetical protein ABC974_25350 [Sphingomonas oligophenolica]|uniref:Uncharacterized protein n=1 Tax=Sphingomonas oligophenolica TaxID=301154 RepID=A0ABU9YAY9_9SPHN
MPIAAGVADSEPDAANADFSTDRRAERIHGLQENPHESCQALTRTL